MAFTTVHSRDTLRKLLESVARLESDSISQSQAAELAFAFRDCRLELSRLVPEEFSLEEWCMVAKMEGRLELVANGDALPESIVPAAKRTLDYFGWPTNT